MQNSGKRTGKSAAARKKTAKTSASRKKQPAARRAAASARPRGGSVGSSDQVSASRRIDEYISGLPDWRGERLGEIRALIHEADPDVVEEWKWMGSPVWSHDGIFVVGNAHKEKVKLTFAQGARLADAGKLFNAGLGGNRWRAIDLYEGDKVPKAAFKALIREAVACNIKIRAAKKSPR